MVWWIRPDGLSSQSITFASLEARAVADALADLAADLGESKS